MSNVESSIDSGAEIFQGSRYERNYQWLEDGLPADLTGATGTFKVANQDYSAILFTGTVTVTDAVNGRFSCTIDAATTGAYTPSAVASSQFLFLSGGGSEMMPFNILIDRGHPDGPEEVVRGVAKFYRSAL